MNNSNRQTRSWLRFSLASFLFVCLCIGGSIAGYQSGFRFGFDSGKEARYNASQATEFYSYASFVLPDLSEQDRDEDIRWLVDLIRSTVAPDVWESSENEIRVFQTNRSLKISAPGTVHRELRELFQQLDRIANRKLAAQLNLIPNLQRLASEGQSRASAFPISVQKSSPLASQWLEKSFRVAADEISKQWGRPSFDGACEDKKFPLWSLDQKLVAWRRGSGVVFLSLRFMDDGQMHLMSGFQADG